MGCFASREPVDFDGPVEFNHFDILRAIGKGAFGKVCIVKKKDTKKMYAMKYMNKIQIIQKKAVDNVYREIQILKSLDHPFLVNLWFSFQDREDIFVVIDLMLGGDLSYHLEKELRFPVQRVQLYVAELMLAVDYLQSKRIIHRDLKPANMLLDSQGHIHLTDFNVACIVREGRPVTSMTGTKPYMAPEVVHSSRKGYTFSVDWWSLGVSAYEMLRGERPFTIHHHMTQDDIYQLLTQTRPPASSKWDEATCNLLKMLLHPDPNRRLSSLEQAKSNQFFASLEWDKVTKKEIVPPYVPSQNRIHCDPTHELEEMIVEPNPLHKKSSRLSRKHKSLDEDLTRALEKIEEKFPPYDRLRQALAKLESHEVESSKEVEGAAVSTNGGAAADAVVSPAAITIEVTPSAVVEHQLSEQQGEVKDPPLASPDDKDIGLGKEDSAQEEEPSIKVNGDAILLETVVVETVERPAEDKVETEELVQLEIETEPVQNSEEQAEEKAQDSKEQGVENKEGEETKEQPVENEEIKEQPVENEEERIDGTIEQPVENGEEGAQREENQETTQVDDKQSPQPEESRASAEPTHTVNSPNHSLEEQSTEQSNDQVSRTVD